MAKFADIIVDRHHQKVDQIYTYAVPAALQTVIRPGWMAEVPFGQGDHVLKGYVIRVAEESAFAESRLKPVRRLLGREPLFTEQELALAEYIRDQWGATLSSALALFVPRDPEAELRLCCRITLSEQKGSGRLGMRQTALLQYLAERPEHSALREELPQEIAPELASLRSLEKNGWITMTNEPEGLPPAAFISEKPSLPPPLNEEQQRAAAAVEAAAEQERYEGFLLHGITGSGKTEVYLHCIEAVRQRGRQAILLVPEIGLTPQLIRVLEGRFGRRAGVLHSRMTDAERSRQWHRIRRGDYDVVLGPRSALFAPLPQLGLVLIDEEHETSYKSEEMPAYHAREVAEELCRRKKIPLVLGSATPSVETYYRAQQGEYTLLTLTRRATGAALPQVRIADMRQETAEGNMSLFCRELTEAIRQRLEQGEQTILFLNRKGYATFVNCRSCGFVLRCPRCYLPYTYHRDKNKLICHHCGKAVDLPKVCPQCGSVHIRQFGVGTQRVEAEAAALFPQARVRRMDQNTTGRRQAYEELYHQMNNREIDILVGTQMVAKGFDFPHVTLVGIVAADMLLFGPDYHNTERTFQLLTQAAGRAGRGNRPGEVILQSFAPEHYCIQKAWQQDYLGFYQSELLARQIMDCPPFAHILQLLVSGPKEEAVQRETAQLFEILQHYGRGRGFVLLGPAPASLGRINNTFRWKILIKHAERDRLLRYGKYCVDQLLRQDIRSVVAMDMDPAAIL